MRTFNSRKYTYLKRTSNISLGIGVLFIIYKQFFKKYIPDIEYALAPIGAICLIVFVVAEILKSIEKKEDEK